MGYHFPQACGMIPPKTLKKQRNECDCKCKSGHDVLFGPDRDCTISHEFAVTDKFVQVCLFADPCFDVRVYLEQVYNVCGERCYRPAGTTCGHKWLDHHQPTKILHLTGRYRAVLHGACADEVLVTQSKIRTPASITADAC